MLTYARVADDWLRGGWWAEKRCKGLAGQRLWGWLTGVHSGRHPRWTVDVGVCWLCVMLLVSCCACCGMLQPSGLTKDSYTQNHENG